jgi:sugar lactone lactonase YvrE
MNRVSAEVAFRTPCSLGEGSLWNHQAGVLLWVDIDEHKVFVFDPHNGSNLAYDVGESVGTVVVSRNDKLLLGLRSGLAFLDPSTGEIQGLVDPEAHLAGNRFNDGKCDPQGRFWAGTMVEQGPRGGAALYRLDTDLSVTKQIEGVTISNGLVWSRNSRRFFYIDTPTHQVRGYDFEPETGNLRAPSVVAEISQELGAPDGMAIDEQDHLWIALFNGGRVIRVDPKSGEVEFEVEVPADNVTSCAFGGPDLDVLYITTARVGLDAERRAKQPLAGSLFRAKVPYCGVPAARFGGDL